MKYRLPLCTIILGFSLLVNTIQAQYWCRPGAQWTYSYQDVSGYEANPVLTYVGDTTLLGHQCQVIKGTGWAWPLYPNGTTEPLTVGPYYTFSSSDTVYFFQTDSFTPIYYFGAHVGDTVWCKVAVPSFVSYTDSFLQLVDSVGFDTINNQALKYYVVSNIDSAAYPPTGKIIQYFGALSYITPVFWTSTDGPGYGLRCYQDDSFPSYQLYPGLPCDFLSAIQTAEGIYALTIYPNPAKNYVTIETDASAIGGALQITDITGREVGKLQITNSKFRIPTSALSPGVYLVHITDLNGRTAIGKLTIQ